MSSQQQQQLQQLPIIYGQVVAGPPGSGKTTYCTGMQEYLRLLGRNAYVINLDPANEVPKSTTKKTKTSSNNDDRNNDDGNNNDNHNNLPYETIFDVCDDVVNLSSVMKQLNLGPNGGLLYCMEYIEAHVQDIITMISNRIQHHISRSPNGNNIYLLFDLPGQVELYTHGTCVHKILHTLSKKLNLRLVVVQLIDSHYCTEVTHFISAVLLGTTTMLRLELPTVNVLSKIDLLVNYGPLPFNLDFFTNCNDLNRLLSYLQQDGRFGGVGSSSGGASDGDEYYDDDDNYFNDEYNINNTNETNYDSYADDVEYQQARSKRRLSKFYIKHEKLHKALTEIIDDFSLMSFLPLDISNAESVGRVVTKIDKCNGYIFINQQQNQQPSQPPNKLNTSQEQLPSSSSSSPHYDLLQCAIQTDSSYEVIADIQERLVESRQQLKQKQKKGSTTATTSTSK